MLLILSINTIGNQTETRMRGEQKRRNERTEEEEEEKKADRERLDQIAKRLD